MEPKYDAAAPNDSGKSNSANNFKLPDYKKSEYARTSMKKVMDYKFWTRFIERGKSYVGLLQQLIRNPDAESSLAVYDVNGASGSDSASRLAEENGIKKTNDPVRSLRIYGVNSSLEAKAKKAGLQQHGKKEDEAYSYNPNYSRYWAETTIEKEQKRRNLFYGTIGEYVSHLFKKLRHSSEKPNLEVYGSSGSDLSDKAKPDAISANSPRLGVVYRDKFTGEYKTRMPIMPQDNTQDLEQRLVG